MYTFKGKQVSWVDIEAPSRDDLAYLKRTHHLNPMLLSSLGTPTTRPHVEEFDGVIYVVIHVPLYNADKYMVEPVELDFVLIKDTLLTIHYKPIQPIEELKRQLEAAPKEHGYMFEKNVVFAASNLFDEIFEFFLRELDHIQRELNDIQEHIFAGNERKMVKRISLTTANIINFRRAVLPQRAFLKHLADLGVDIFGPKSRTHFHDIQNNFARVEEQLENHFDTIQSLSNTNESLLSSKINQVVSTLTVITGLILPFQFILELNDKGRDREGFFWIIMVLFLAVEILVLWRLHRKKML
ncbi:MAG: Mg2 transporter protein CorA family protein [Parcubacteria group bacterium GW2011_GWA2_47_8]|nr:MAG: Mg2 transporter protein CorA family protein [Parcubacteria group bacterium GW2011_GWA2_47_8]OHB20462.1 MAG: hypothetical protein A2666_01125 [Parcubacteria group bacterium RIFCSPHIGHO2_01_FULL_47_10b]